jgi:RNA polymerase sigma-70 factor (ECF subfamily)
MKHATGDDTEKLLARAAHGDAEAVGDLLKRHRDRLKRMIAIRLDPRLNPRIDPSDVIQESLAEAARKLPQYIEDRPLPFYPWLREIAWNNLVNLYRFHIGGQKRSVSREIGLAVNLSNESIQGFADMFAASESSPSRNMQREELRDRVRAAICELPTKFREAIVLRYLEQLSVEETAAVLGIAQGTVKSRLFRGMNILSDLLDDQS